ncbi:MAG: ABC transporter permease, partial [Heliobacteriaceae bacterium]|nr:ABC transporter permease [Heliobacteriaceae bacterium]
MLNRKLWRDIRENRLAYFSAVLVIAIGLMLFVGLQLVIQNLDMAISTYYQEQVLADLFVEVQVGREETAGRLRGIPEVKAVETYLQQRVQMDTGEPDRLGQILLRSWEPTNRLNRVKLVKGRFPAAGQAEVLFTPFFLQANHLEIGDVFPVVVGGKKETLTVVGAFISPEYVYEIDVGGLAPNPRNFGVGIVDREKLAVLTGHQGQFNRLALTFRDQGAAVKVRTLVQDYLADTTVTGIYFQKDHPSVSLLDQELAGLRKTATTLPLFFLLVAGFILYNMLSRLVANQRGQIGILKAMGYPDRQIFRHYLHYATFTGLAGGILGGLGGLALAEPLTALYTMYFQVPGLVARWQLWPLVIGLLLALGFTWTAGWQGVRTVLRLSPAEALRPEPPPAGNRLWLEKAGFLWAKLQTGLRMALRNVFRNRRRSLFTLLGIFFAYVLITTAFYLQDAVDYLLDFTYNYEQNYDGRVIFQGTVDAAVAGRFIGNLLPVETAEPVGEVGAVISRGPVHVQTGITALPQAGRLYQVYDEKGQRVLPARHGLVLSARLAQKLGVTAGDWVYVQPFLAEAKGFTLPVTGVVAKYLGMGAYTELTAFGTQLPGGKPLATGVVFKLRPEAEMSQLFTAVRDSPLVLAVSDLREDERHIRELMSKQSQMMGILVLFAFISGLSIVYNSST